MIELGGGDGYAYGLLAYAYAREGGLPAGRGRVPQRDAAPARQHRVAPRAHAVRLQAGEVRRRGLAARRADRAAIPTAPSSGCCRRTRFIGLKQPLKAAENLEVVDRLGKSTVDSLYMLGDIYSGENLLDLAAAPIVRAIDLDPKQPFARPLRAAELLAQRGARSRRRGRSASRTSSDPGAPRSRRPTRASCSSSRRASRWPRARGARRPRRSLEEILRLDPLDGEALMLLGQHYAQAEPARPGDPLSTSAPRASRRSRSKRRSATRRCSSAWAATPTRFRSCAARRRSSRARASRATSSRSSASRDRRGGPRAAKARASGAGRSYTFASACASEPRRRREVNSSPATLLPRYRPISRVASSARAAFGGSVPRERSTQSAERRGRRTGADVPR